MFRPTLLAVLLLGAAACGGPTPAPAAYDPLALPTPEVTEESAAPVLTTVPAPKPTTTAKGKVVVLDPGHNGGNAGHPMTVNALVDAGFGQRKPCNTTGTATRADYPEHAFTWDVSNRIRADLVKQGVTVLLTRPDDMGVGPCVDKRAAYGNQQKADAVVAVHGDGHEGGNGFHVIDAARAPVGASGQVQAASKRLAADVHDAYLAKSGIGTSTYLGTDGYDHRTDLAGLNLSVRPTIFIECGNMLDPHDAGIMSTPAGRQRIADAIAAGISKYLTTQ